VTAKTEKTVKAALIGISAVNALRVSNASINLNQLQAGEP